MARIQLNPRRARGEWRRGSGARRWGSTREQGPGPIGAPDVP